VALNDPFTPYSIYLSFIDLYIKPLNPISIQPRKRTSYLNVTFNFRWWRRTISPPEIFRSVFPHPPALTAGTLSEPLRRKRSRCGCRHRAFTRCCESSATRRRRRSSRLTGASRSATIPTRWCGIRQRTSELAKPPTETSFRSEARTRRYRIHRQGRCTIERWRRWTAEDTASFRFLLVRMTRRRFTRRGDGKRTNAGRRSLLRMLNFARAINRKVWIESQARKESLTENDVQKLLT